MKVLGSGKATVHYRINGGAEQTEVVTLPWSKQYQVYDEVETSVTADGATGCSIIMGEMLAAYQDEPNPTCSFAYYG
ncbi:hypothetical protein KIH27_18070 [Mycobacterium sp. M1]|uniref:Uncharacterized protein n=2 Tax=Mycolicibacter acidiphilus TaxID=2835306 RepID=A0ABS5RMG3_9MYCO|nr:hypothetical protein [Mycolicibacter acidiphilus]